MQIPVINSDQPLLIDDRDAPYLEGYEWVLLGGEVVARDGDLLVKAIDLVLDEKGGRVRDGNPLDLRRENLELDRGVSYLPSADAWRAAISHQRQPFFLGKSRNEEKARRMYVERAPDMRRLLSGRALGLKPTNVEGIAFDPVTGMYLDTTTGKAARNIVTLKK